jgi:hypothetical protein
MPERVILVGMRNWGQSAPCAKLWLVFDDKQHQEGRGRKLRLKVWYVRLIFEGSYDAGFNSLSVRPPYSFRLYNLCEVYLQFMLKNVLFTIAINMGGPIGKL